MLLRKVKCHQSVGPGTGEHFKGKKRCRWPVWLLPLSGLAALVWFLVRVIPKPSRAAYPCQRVAFPLASGFVIWLAGAIASIAAVRKARCSLVQRRYVLCAMLVAASICVLWLAQCLTVETPLAAQEVTPNAPMGTAKGIHPV